MEPRIKVLMVSGDSSPLQDTGSYFSRVLKELSNYWEIDVLCPKSPSGKSETKIGDVRIFASMVPKIAYLANSIHPKLKKNYDLVVSQDPSIYGILAYIIAKLKGAKKIFELHGYYIDNSHWHATSPKNLILSKIGVQMLNKADKIRIVSKGIADLPALSDIPKSKFLYIPSNYIDTGVFKPGGKRMFDKRTILFVGRLVPEKNIGLIFEAFKMIKGKEDIRLAIVGDGPLLDNLESKAKKLKISKDVSFLGRVSNEDLPNYYSSAELLLMTSHHEGGPRVVFEAMACGTPTISTRVGQVPDIVKDGADGIILESNTPEELASETLKLLSDKNRLEEMGRKAREKVKKRCEWKDLISNYGETYADVVSK